MISSSREEFHDGDTETRRRSSVPKADGENNIPDTLLDWLLEKYPVAKRQTLKRMVQAGRVTVNGRPAATLKHPLGADDKVVVDAPQLRSAQAREAAQRPSDLRIVYEDADILVLDKPAGLLTSTVPREPRPTLWAMARDEVRAREPRARVGLIHRLDRDASGLLIFSKNDPAYQSLKTQFFKHTVHREYTAVVHGLPSPPAGRIESQLVERADGTVHSTRQTGKGQIAVTHFEVVKSMGNQSLLRVVLETGRKHQIRVHLSERGWPIVGDKVYGREGDAGRLMLAATRLVIRHPHDDREMTFAMALPGDFALTLP
jgi:23S rRNA pseudouridine1911/1915/1917 synthase